MEITEPPRGLRARIGDWIESTPVQRVIIAVILVNAVILGMETSPGLMESHGWLLVMLDRACLFVFVVEIGLKLVAFRHRFFCNGWNVFDFIVVGIALVPASGPFAVLRSLRVLRVLRLFSAVPKLRSVVDALLRAIPAMLSIMAVMGLVFYVSAVVAAKLFGADFPQWFGSIGASMYSLFQIMTLESWSMGIVRPVMEVFPLAWMFFVPFVIITSFAVLNMFIALLVNSIQDEHDKERTVEMDAMREAAHQEALQLGRQVNALQEEMVKLRQALERRGRL